MDESFVTDTNWIFPVCKRKPAWDVTRDDPARILKPTEDQSADTRDVAS
jgi:hypothetical protein